MLLVVVVIIIIIVIILEVDSDHVQVSITSRLGLLIQKLSYQNKVFTFIMSKLLSASMYHVYYSPVEGMKMSCLDHSHTTP